MIVAVHQPNYLPWLGYFGKILSSDCFVILDDVQFTKRGYQNRVQIQTPGGVRWLTQPVRTSGRYHQSTREVRFVDPRWGKEHWKTLVHSYGRAPFFRELGVSLRPLLEEPGEWLAACNVRLIRWACEVLGCRTPLLLSSELLKEEDPLAGPTDRIVRIVRKVGGDTYLSGQGGFHYQDLEQLASCGIRTTSAAAVFPEYPQQGEGFVSGLSVIDLLMNCGPRGREWIEGGAPAAPAPDVGGAGDLRTGDRS